MNSKILRIISFFCFVGLCLGEQAFAGACGTSANGAPSPNMPNWGCNLCVTCTEGFAGMPSRSGNFWVWYCGSTYCTTPWGQPGTCNATYSGQVLTALPGDTSTLCSNGTTYSALSSDSLHNWNWQCLGLNGAANTTCYADQNLCGSANGGTYSTPPTSGLCATGGTAGAVATNPDKYLWTCSTALTPSDYICNANRTGNTTGVGSANGQNFSSPPTANLCQSGWTASAVTTNATTYTWTCYNWTQVGWTDNWRAVAMSSDGRYQTAVTGAQGTPCTGNIYVSTDYGVNWTAKAPVVGVWTGIAMSADGRYQTATPFDGSTYNSRIQLYVSSDYGNTWQPKATVKAWTTVAMSSNGQYQLAGADNNGVYLSTDSGNTWTQTSLPTSSVFWENQLGMSGDGKYMVASPAAYSALYVSSDYGVTWTQKSTEGEYVSGSTVGPVGRHMTAYTYYPSGGHWTSRDYGVTWVNRGSPNSGVLSISASEQKQLGGNGYSNDFGITWTTVSPAGFGGTAMSSTGQYQTGVTLYGQIWRSSNFGGDNNGVGSANRMADASCGTAATRTSTKPTTNLCGDGSLPTVNGTGPWTWTCQGINGGNNASCTAPLNHSPVVTAGSYGPLNSAQVVAFNASTATDEDSDSLTYTWACPSGSFSSTAVLHPNYTAPTVSSDTTVTCGLIVTDGHGGAGGANTNAITVRAIINTSCGSDNTLSSYTAPTNLCTNGGTVVDFYGPNLPSGSPHNSWVWICNSPNGGSGQSGCYTNLKINGALGSACGKTYASGASGYSPDAQCSAGTSTNTNFPTEGASVTWACNGINGGTNTSTCSASRSSSVAANGACGTANGKITTVAPTNPPVPNTTPNPLCNAGTASAFTETSPWKWTCVGSSTTSNCATAPLPIYQEGSPY